ncbi:hypothetical protein ACLOJK_018702 [Asimina triloba]
MARQTYSYIDYSPTAITLAAEGNWLMLTATTSSAPQPSHKAATLIPRFGPKVVSAADAPSAPSPACKVVISTPWSFHKTVTMVVASPAPRPSHKVSTLTPRSFHKTVFAAVASSTPQPSQNAATLTPRSFHKTVFTATASSMPRPSHKTATSTPLSAHKTVSTTVAASSASGRIKKRSRKAGPASQRTTSLNHEDAQPVLPSPHYSASHSGSRRSRRAPTTAPRKEVVVAVKRGDLPPGWCYLSCRHNTYPQLFADYWIQVWIPNQFGPLIDDVLQGCQISARSQCAIC